MNDSKKICSFTGKYAFLSNFYPCMVVYDGMKYPSAEHAFQAAKSLDIDQRIGMAVCPTPGDAKHFGRRLHLREDWEEVKVSVMLAVVRDKFIRNDADEDIRELLLATGDAYLEEGNTHGDCFWGAVKGEGRNELGKILMQVRDELKSGIFPPAPHFEGVCVKLRVISSMVDDVKKSLDEYGHNTKIVGESKDKSAMFIRVYAPKNNILSYVASHSPDVLLLEPSEMRQPSK